MCDLILGGVTKTLIEMMTIFVAIYVMNMCCSLFLCLYIFWNLIPWHIICHWLCSLKLIDTCLARCHLKYAWMTVLWLNINEMKHVVRMKCLKIIFLSYTLCHIHTCDFKCASDIWICSIAFPEINGISWFF